VPVETRDGSFPAKLIITAQSFKREFANSGEIASFLDRERKFWADIRDKLAVQPVTLRGVPGQFFETSTVAVFNGLNAGDDEKAIRALKVIDERQPIISEGRYGALVSVIAEENPTAVPWLVASIVGAHIPDVPQNLQNGAVNSHELFRALKFIPPFLESQRTAKDRRGWALLNDLANLKSEVEQLRESVKQWQSEAQAKADAALAEFSLEQQQATDAMKQQLDGALAEGKALTNDLEERVRKRIILEAPTTYWNAKAKSHNIIAGVAGIIFALVLIVGTMWLTHGGIEVVGKAHDRLAKGSADIGLLAFVPLAFITIPVLAIAWLLRHVSRLIVQNLALAADAKLRGTIATTYSALTHDRETTGAELALALQALFRPLDGSEHAEVAPPSLSDVMAMTLKK
jgi:hypothetical protein